MNTRLLQVLKACKNMVDAFALGRGISYNPFDMITLSNTLAIEINGLESKRSGSPAVERKG